jgi:hypothetical protein
LTLLALLVSGREDEVWTGAESGSLSAPVESVGKWVGAEGSTQIT